LANWVPLTSSRFSSSSWEPLGSSNSTSCTSSRVPLAKF
jgi:hypothetical protein